MMAGNLFERKKAEVWDELFKDSYTVHFYASSSPNNKILRPKFYGSDVPAYLHLGIQHCPLSFFSEKMF